MPDFYLLRPNGTYSDAGNYPSQPTNREDGSWITGTPDALTPYAGEPSFQETIRLAYQALPVGQQIKYQQDILMAAFQLERQNPLLVAVNILLAEERLTEEESLVLEIIESAKTELGPVLMAAAATELSAVQS